LSEDPAGYQDGLNLYNAYFDVNGRDPLGLESGLLDKQPKGTVVLIKGREYIKAGNGRVYGFVKGGKWKNYPKTGHYSNIFNQVSKAAKDPLSRIFGQVSQNVRTNTPMIVNNTISNALNKPPLKLNSPSNIIRMSANQPINVNVKNPHTLSMPNAQGFSNFQKFRMGLGYFGSSVSAYKLVVDSDSHWDNIFFSPSAYEKLESSYYLTSQTTRVLLAGGSLMTKQSVKRFVSRASVPTFIVFGITDGAIATKNYIKTFEGGGEFTLEQLHNMERQLLRKAPIGVLKRLGTIEAHRAFLARRQMIIAGMFYEEMKGGVDLPQMMLWDIAHRQAEEYIKLRTGEIEKNSLNHCIK